MLDVLGGGGRLVRTGARQLREQVLVVLRGTWPLVALGQTQQRVLVEKVVDVLAVEVIVHG